MKLAIIGSRSIGTLDLADYINEVPAEIITGGAAGIDSIAEAYAKKNGVPVTIITPDYKQYKRVAPLVRNKEIVRRCDKLLAI